MSLNVSHHSSPLPAPTPISFWLAARLMVSGTIAVVLHLYRHGHLIHTSTLMSCERRDLAAALETCRAHLQKRGIAEEAAPRQAPAPQRHRALSSEIARRSTAPV